MFIINDHCYEIEHAFLDAQLDDEEKKCLYIGIVIHVKKTEEDKRNPAIISDTILIIKKNEIKQWQDISGKIIEWEKFQKNIWKPYLQFWYDYKKTHRSNFVYNVKIEFLNIDNEIYVKIKGLCDSKFNGKEMETLSIEIKTKINFHSIHIGNHKNEDDARNKLNPYLESENFIYKITDVKLPDGTISKIISLEYKNKNGNRRLV